MARSRLCRVCKDWHSTDSDWPRACYGHFGATAHGAGPNIISDHLDGVLSHVDGRMYDSKSRYYASVKAAGCEIVGNEKIRPQPVKRSPVGPDIMRALQQLQSR
jgi:hypothetical protein